MQLTTIQYLTVLYMMIQQIHGLTMLTASLTLTITDLLNTTAAGSSWKTAGLTEASTAMCQMKWVNG